jgi:hypothetical protein
MIATFLSRTGTPGMAVGNPILSILESATQSDLRSSQDIFNQLSASSLERATGLALDRVGISAGVARLVQLAAQGYLTIGDSSFDKVASRVYQGAGAPIAGSTTIKVEDGTDFPSSGTFQIYLGRGTINYEGPLTVASLVDSGSYWTFTLSTPTTKFHQLGESVILAQGGNRTVSAGTLARTAGGATGTPTTFSIVYAATLPDGETEVTGVQAICETPGVLGNAVLGSVTGWQSEPFDGATVTNPNPFINGRDTETDDSYKLRIRQVEQSRAKGTALAITTAVTGVVALDENKSVISANLVRNNSEPQVLYIDDGTGYEEQSEGVSYEVLIDSAVGGEQYFQLANGRPVAKAFLKTSLSAPFSLVDDSQLAMTVGGERTVHTFQSDEFADIATATAYEVSASINADENIGWISKLVDNGQKVIVLAKTDTNEEILNSDADAGFVDANTYLGFGAQEVQSLNLYKNDRLLTKDGSLATVESEAQSLWDTISSGDGMTISVDGINVSSLATVTNSDFINAETGYTTVNKTNSLESWAAVFNYKIPGITATVSGSTIVLTSNRGRDDSASVVVNGGTLGAAMFGSVSSTGATSDYTLNRNLGTIKLATALTAGDKLSANSTYTRAFIEADDSIASLTIAAEATSVSGQTGAELWFIVDGDAELISTGITGGLSCAVTLNNAASWGDRVQYTFASGTLTNIAVGDWVIVTDLGLNIANRGAFRVANTDSSTYFQVERSSSWASVETVTLTNGNIWVIRSEAIPQRVFIDDGTNYTAYSLAASINTQLIGATAETYQTSKLRIRSNTDNTGDISLVASNETAKDIGLTIASAVDGSESAYGYATANHLQHGTPQFSNSAIATVASTTSFDVASITDIHSQDLIVGLRAVPDTGPTSRYSNKNFVTTIDNISGAGPYTIATRTAITANWLPEDRFYAASPYAITPRDQLVAVVDENEVSKRYAINMYRNVTPTTNTYGATNAFTDADNSDLSLAVAFGTDFTWEDFAVFMKSRVKDVNGALWRYYRHGSEGDNARIAYNYQTSADTATELDVEYSDSSEYTNISVKLPSGALRSVPGIRNGSYVGVAITASTGVPGLYTYKYIFNLAVATAQRTTNVTTLTLTLPTDVVDHGLSTGEAFYLNSSDVNFTSGLKIITGGNGTTTITYADVAADAGPIASIGTVSRDTVGEVTLNGSTVTVGDIFNIADGTGFTTVYSSTIARTIKTLTVANDVISGQSPEGPGATSTTITWAKVNDSSLIQFYPIDTGSNTTTAIVAAINALAGIVTGTVITSASIVDASYEAAVLGGADPWYYLTDGVNYVRSNTTPGSPSTNYSFTFKNAITAGLASACDWENEDVRLVPITAQAVVDYLSEAAVSGLFDSAEIAVANESNAVQITTNTIGSSGSVEVQGGGANENSAAVVGGAALSGDDTSIATYNMVVSVNNADAESFTAGTWVEVQNTDVAPKSVIDASTTLTSIAVDGTVTLNAAGTKAWTWANLLGDGGTGVYDDRTWQIEKQGGYVALTHLSAYTGAAPDFTGIVEGDWVIIAAAGTPQVTANALNLSTFRIVRVNNTTKTFWIENSDAVEQIASLKLSFIDYNSIMPGDTLNIGTTLWGTNNVGEWTVESLGATQWIFNLDVADATPTVQGAVAALGSSSSLVHVYEGLPTSLTKKIIGIAPNTSNEDLTDLKFETAYGYANVGSVYGSVVRALDKLYMQVNESTGSTEFIVFGVDGYQHNTGLIAEVNKVVFGDESDEATYPGVAASGDAINIFGPYVRRIEVSLALRVNTGVSTQDIENKVKSAVASVINSTDVGSSIAISAIISAAQSINGVTAVTVLSPTYTSGSDLISVQPYEKPLVINVDDDVLISFVGAS